MTESPDRSARPSLWLNGLLGLGVGLVAVGLWVRNPAEPVSPPAPADTGFTQEDFESEPLPPMKPEKLRAESGAPEDTARIRERPSLPGPMSESERVRLMEEQVQALREYARRNGPDDPFSMTEERIEAFRQRGNPFLE